MKLLIYLHDRCILKAASVETTKLIWKEIEESVFFNICEFERKRDYLYIIACKQFHGWIC